MNFRSLTSISIYNSCGSFLHIYYDGSISARGCSGIFYEDGGYLSNNYYFNETGL
jgi:hypothetical protein